MAAVRFLLFSRPIHLPPAMEPAPTPPPSDRPASTAGQPPPPAPAHVPPASATGAKPDSLKRFLAKLVDGLIAAVLFWVIALVLPGWIGTFLGTVVAAAYWIVSDGLDLEFMYRRSLGKKLLGLNVVRMDGRPMDIESSARRNWMFALSWFYYPATWILGLIISLVALVIFVYEVYKVLTEPDGHRWGDELAGTRVVTAEAD